MRVRFPLPVVAVAALVSALVVVALLSALVVGCGGEETTAPAAMEAPATAAPTPADEESGYVTVDVETAYDALSTSEDAQLIDVREPAEWAETGVPRGAVLIPLGELEERAADELRSGSPVYVICRSGNRSRTGSDILVGLGFSEVYNVDGGITAWLAAGLPVEPYEP